MKKHVFDYSKLLGRIRELSLTQEECAKNIGVSAQSFNYKLNNKRSFNQVEIKKLVELLKLDCTEIKDYFFIEKV